MVGVGGLRARGPGDGAHGAGRFCVPRGRLAVVTGPASGSIHESEARTRMKRASVRQQAQGRSARGALLFGAMLRDGCSGGDFSLFLGNVSAGKSAHGGNLHQGLFHRRIAERIRLLHQVDPQHGGQRIRRPASLLAGLGVVGSIGAISGFQGTTTTISERNLSRMFCFLAVVSSYSEKPSCLPPINPVLTCGHMAIASQIGWVFRSLTKKCKEARTLLKNRLKTHMLKS